MSSFLATKGECFQERLKPCALLLVTGLSVSESFVCVWGGIMGGCSHEVGWHHEVWSEQTLKTEAQRHWDELAGLEESMAYRSETPIRVGVWSG